MRIAATYEDGKIFQHFGHAERFKIYDVEDGKVTVATVVNTNGSGHGALAGLLKNLQVETLVCGGIGGGAIEALSTAGIKVHAGVCGDADAVVAQLLAGTLVASAQANCDHHGQEHHGGSCGEHGCGGHEHGHHGN